jgi:hypothetical protein
MNIRTIIVGALMVGGLLGNVSCMSTSPAKALNSEQTRLQQQRQGLPDREDSKQQRKDEEYAFQEALKRKS